MKLLTMMPLAMVTIAASMASHAASQSQATFNNVQFQVIDLAADDGQAAAYSFDNMHSVGWASAFEDSGRSVLEDGDLPGMFTSQERTADAEGISTRYAISPDSLSVFSFTSGYRARTEVGAQVRGDLSLAPHSALRVTGDLSVFVGAMASTAEYAGTSLFMYFNDSTHMFVRSALAPRDGAETRLAERISFDIDNSSDSWQTGRFILSLDTGTFGPAVPVPEPQTYALMLAGLAVLSRIARRKTFCNSPI